ncbi:hypothetical protein AB0D57_45005 [Streptomyces sp. NPDC048275]|uniref:hypothetical protein n=1 Tax=Streptomyces sp. NPDC048275 TaxID=3155629 RepID=UPI0033DCFF5C
MGTDEHVCPVCRQPVATVVRRRHKTLGAFVPVWGPGPCRNPKCEANADQSDHEPGVRPEEPAKEEPQATQGG